MKKWGLVFLLLCAPCLSFAVNAANPSDTYVIGVSTSVIAGFSGTVYQVSISTNQIQQLFNQVWQVSAPAPIPVNIGGVTLPEYGQLFSFMMGCLLCFVFILGIKSA